MASPPSLTSSADRPSLSALLLFLHLLRARLYSCVVMGSFPLGMLLLGACGGRPCWSAARASAASCRLSSSTALAAFFSCCSVVFPLKDCFCFYLDVFTENVVDMARYFNLLPPLLPPLLMSMTPARPTTIPPALGPNRRQRRRCKFAGPGSEISLVLTVSLPDLPASPVASNTFQRQQRDYTHTTCSPASPASASTANPPPSNAGNECELEFMA